MVLTSQFMVKLSCYNGFPKSLVIKTFLKPITLEHSLLQSFSTSALLIFRISQSFAVGSVLMHCMMFGWDSGLYPLDASSTPIPKLWQAEVSPDISKCPCYLDAPNICNVLIILIGGGDQRAGLGRKMLRTSNILKPCYSLNTVSCMITILKYFAMVLLIKLCTAQQYIDLSIVRYIISND